MAASAFNVHVLACLQVFCRLQPPLWVVSIRTSRSQPSRTGAWLSSPLLWVILAHPVDATPADGCPTRHSRSGCGAGPGPPIGRWSARTAGGSAPRGPPTSNDCAAVATGQRPARALFRSGSPPGMPGSGCPGRQRTARGVGVAAHSPLSCASLRATTWSRSVFRPHWRTAAGVRAPHAAELCHHGGLKRRRVVGVVRLDRRASSGARWLPSTLPKWHPS